MKFAGRSFSEPSTCAILSGVMWIAGLFDQQRAYVPRDHRWLLGLPRAYLIEQTGLAAKRSDERERRLAMVKQECLSEIARMETEQASSSMPDGEFSERLANIAGWHSHAEIDLLEAQHQLLAHAEAMSGLLALALGARWQPTTSAEVTTHEAAALLQCSRRHVQRLAQAGLLPARLHPDGSWRCLIKVPAEPHSLQFLRAGAARINARRAR